MRYLIHSVALYLKTCLKPRRCVRCHAGAMTCPATFQRHVCRSSMKFRARRGMRYEVGGIVRCGEVVWGMRYYWMSDRRGMRYPVAELWGMWGRCAMWYERQTARETSREGERGYKRGMMRELWNVARASRHRVPARIQNMLYLTATPSQLPSALHITHITRVTSLDICSIRLPYRQQEPNRRRTRQLPHLEKAIRRGAPVLYVYIHTFICIYLHIHIHVCIHTHVYMYMYMYTYVHIYI